MTTFKVVSMHIFFDCFSCFTDITILSKIGFLIFKTPKSAFNHDIICPATFTIHTLTDTVLFEKSLYSLLVNWQPWSEFRITGFATINAFFNAFRTILVSRVSSTSQPTIQRLYQSITAVRYKNLCLMGM